MKKLLLSLCLLVPALASTLCSHAAQVSSVRFLIRYDSVSCLYDVLMYLETGDIQAGSTQAVYTQQLSLIVPTGSNVGGNLGLGILPVNVTNHEPQFGSYNGTTNTVSRTGIPAPWAKIDALTNPTPLSGSDVYSFSASTFNTYWPATPQGDTILLFKVSIVTPTNNCGQGIRIWNNNIIKGSTVSGGDPSSSTPGMFGQDFNNGISIGNTSQTFNGAYNPVDMSEAKPNVTSSVTPSTVVTSSGKSTTITGASSTATSSCYTIASTNWTGPNTFTANTPGFTINNAGPASFGLYTLTVTNSLGCSTVKMHDITYALPVHLLSFDGYASGCQARLSWEVAPGQQDLQAFELQYSNDGARFTTVAHLERNPASDLYTYSYAQAAGKGYYRLMIIERSGAAEFSKTVSVSTSCESAPITIAPNPTHGQAMVSGIASGDQVKVSDVLGNVIANYISAGSNAIIDLAVYPPGIYSVIISRNHQILKTDKITKQ